MKEVFVLLLTFCACAYSANILFFPANINSHVIYFTKLARGLANQGHNVEILVSSALDIPLVQYRSNDSNATSSSLTFAVYKDSSKHSFANTEEMSKMLIDAIMSEFSWTQFWKNLQLENQAMTPFEEDCLNVLKNQELRNNLSQSGFQFAIVDTMVPQCRNLLPILLGIPFATFSMSRFSLPYRIPRLSSFSPYMGDSWTNKMNFYQRLSTFLKELFYVAFHESVADYSEELLPPGREKLTTVKLVQKANLWLILEDISVNYPNSYMPNTISVGDIMIDNDIKPLSKDLEDFIRAQDNIRKCAIVSLGSFFDFVPDALISRFCNAFKLLDKRVAFIWKLRKPLNETCPGSGNIYILPWLPQNDLLAHISIKFFISHGGANSIIESVNHRKPMIIFPLALDQRGNAAVSASKGFAISMSLSSFTAEQLVENIEILLDDPSYETHAHFHSGILNDKPNSAAERVSHMINHVLKFGDIHLRSPAFDLNHFQFIMFDIFLFLVIILAFIFILLAFLVQKTYKRLANSSNTVFVKRKTKKTL